MHDPIIIYLTKYDFSLQLYDVLQDQVQYRMDTDVVIRVVIWYWVQYAGMVVIKVTHLKVHHPEQSVQTPVNGQTETNLTVKVSKDYLWVSDYHLFR